MGRKAIAVLACAAWFLIMCCVIIPALDLRHQSILLQGLVMVPCVSLYAIIWKLIVGKRAKAAEKPRYKKPSPQTVSSVSNEKADATNAPTEAHGWNQHGKLEAPQPVESENSGLDRVDKLTISTIVFVLVITVIGIIASKHADDASSHGKPLQFVYKDSSEYKRLVKEGKIKDEDEIDIHSQGFDDYLSGDVETSRRLKYERIFANENTDESAKRMDEFFMEGYNPLGVIRLEDRIISENQNKVRTVVFTKPIRTFLGIEFGSMYNKYGSAEYYGDIGKCPCYKVTGANPFLNYDVCYAQTWPESPFVIGVYCAWKNIDKNNVGSLVSEIKRLVERRYECCGFGNSNDIPFSPIMYSSCKVIRGIPCLRDINILYDEDAKTLYLKGTCHAASRIEGNSDIDAL